MKLKQSGHVITVKDKYSTMGRDTVSSVRKSKALVSHAINPPWWLLGQSSAVSSTNSCLHYFWQLINQFPVFVQVVTTWSMQFLTLEKDSVVYSYLTRKWLCLALPFFYHLVIILFLIHTHIHDHKRSQKFKRKSTLYCKIIVVYLVLFCPW